jgi:hypothetical protein
MSAAVEHGRLELSADAKSIPAVRTYGLEGIIRANVLNRKWKLVSVVSSGGDS